MSPALAPIRLRRPRTSPRAAEGRAEPLHKGGRARQPCWVSRESCHKHAEPPHPADAAGFQLLPRRWVVERTLAWLNRNRRLAKDFEASIASAKAWVYIASVQLLIRRLAI
jgi:transposase